MLMLLRHLLSFAALPFVVTVVIPVWVARRNNVTLSLGTSFPYLLVQALGLVVLGIGIILFVTSLKRFATEGEGTLAPWDPPRKLVVRGPYRYVRNPMISGVIFIVLGEALILLSMPHLQWALVFLAINAVYIPLLEEPQLKDRFGDEYIDYCRHVPRLLPRARPWQADV
jgi:protein-S-isoprenylcysteine O-methyltransferase Ste14